MKPTVIILAAGQGTRMKSALPKVLHLLAEKPILLHILDTAKALSPDQTVLVLGHQADRVRAAVEAYNLQVVLQERQLGTGHAVLQASRAVADASGPVMVLCGDTPLLTVKTLLSLLDAHTRAKAAVTVMTMIPDDPSGYGRIIRDKKGVLRIVEEKDASIAQRKIREVNTGIYCFDKTFLLAALTKITNLNAQGEYYLPDIIALARKSRRRTAVFACTDPHEAMGINSREDLSIAEAVLRARTNRRWMQDGVTMIDPTRVFIGQSVSLGRDIVLYPDVRLEGNTVLGDGCTVYPGTRIADSALGAGVIIKDHCLIQESRIADGASVGPFAHLRPGTVLGKGVRIGNFVEIKKSFINDGSKANHLSYIGDATVGKDVNIGAGVITCNYDGFVKHSTVIEDNVFVGSDAQLVAPVTIGKGAVVAAGATITKNVPPDALAITRVPQNNREGVAARRRTMKQKTGAKHQS